MSAKSGRSDICLFHLNVNNEIKIWVILLAIVILYSRQDYNVYDLKVGRLALLL